LHIRLTQVDETQVDEAQVDEAQVSLISENVSEKVEITLT
jgi:hypothetical protein